MKDPSDNRVEFYAGSYHVYDSRWEPIKWVRPINRSAKGDDIRGLPYAVSKWDNKEFNISKWGANPHLLH